MTRQRTSHIITEMEHAQDVLRHAHIDLDIWLACDRTERARRWCVDFSAADKFNLCALMFARKHGDWTSDDVVEAVAHWDARHAAILAESDRPIPPVSAIVALVRERQETAADHEDWAGYDQLARVISNLDRGATIAWRNGDLHITSVNTPGKEYQVSRRGCSCPNGRAGRAHCWHVATYDLLLDMQQEAADAADVAADAALTRIELGARLAAARRQLLSEVA